MLSEVDELIGQLEYCFLAKKEKAAKEIVRNLARFKAKLKFTVNILYECSSHYSFKEEHFRTADKNAIQEFVDCKHFVCEECLKYYIKSTYEISKADFPFYCPGCLANPKEKPTLLDTKAIYFQESIDKNEFNKSLKDLENLNRTKLSMLKAGLHTECTFIQVPGIDHTAINYIPGCFHVFCTNCLKSHFLNAAMSNSKFTCPLIECRVDVDHHFIATFFGQSTEAEFHLLTKLKLDNHFFVKCFNCQRKQEIDKSVTFAKCKECGAEICKFCGKAQHTEIKCSEISEELSNYNNQDSSNIHRIYLCEQNSKSPELSRYYYHALSLYEWQIVHDNKDFMKKVNPTIADDCEFLLDKVEYVNNIMLLSNYERARAMLNEKNGIDPDEIYVYHGTKNDNVHSICRDGFRVGGVDISSSHGAVYGLGIYTASDPVVSMSYTVGSRNIIVCRALIGNCSAEPIMNDDNLRISKFDYYVASKIPGLNPDSLYYIFFKREFLLPIYVINFK